MLRKSFVFILLSMLACVAASAQDAPQPDEERARRVLELAYTGGGSYMGVEVREISRENFAEMGLREVRGVGIARVIKDSPAEKAGLQPGDVIVRFNGEVLNSRRQLTRLISEVAPDHKAVLTVVRGGAEMEIPVTIGRRPVPRLFTGNFEPPKIEMPEGEWPEVETVIPRGKADGTYIWRMSSDRSIGVGVSPLTDQLAKYFGVPAGHGLLVNRVSKDSPAERAGLRAGDVIVEVEGRQVKGTGDLIRSIYEKKEGGVNLTIIRDKRRQTVTVVPEPGKESGLLPGGNLVPLPDVKVSVGPLPEKGFAPLVVTAGSGPIL